MVCLTAAERKPVVCFYRMKAKQLNKVATLRYITNYLSLETLQTSIKDGRWFQVLQGCLSAHPHLCSRRHLRLSGRPEQINTHPCDSATFEAVLRILSHRFIYYLSSRSESDPRVPRYFLISVTIMLMINRYVFSLLFSSFFKRY